MIWRQLARMAPDTFGKGSELMSIDDKIRELNDRKNELKLGGGRA